MAAQEIRALLWDSRWSTRSNMKCWDSSGAAMTPKALLTCADARLLAAKRAGRAQCIGGVTLLPESFEIPASHQRASRHHA